MRSGGVPRPRRRVLVPAGPRTAARSGLVLLAVAALLKAAVTTAATAAPDLILAGGKVFTADPEHPWAEAVSIGGDRILAVGASKEVRATAGPRTRVIDLQGRVVVPGFDDAHAHVGGGSIGAVLALASNDPPLADVLRVLSAAVAKAPAGTWLRADIGARVLDDPAANRTTLDEITPSHPVLLSAWTGHGALLNTAALKALGVADEVPDPPGGWFERMRGTRRLSGIVQEHAVLGLKRALAAQVPSAEAAASVRGYVQQALRLGITSVQNMGTALPAPRLAVLLREAVAPLRWRIMRVPLNDPIDEDDASEGTGRDDKDGVLVWGRKWILDGTPIERLAAVRQPYADRPVWTGRLDFTPAQVRAIVARARRDREPLLLHVVGDQAADAALSAMEADGGPEVWRPLRPRFEHGDGLTPDLIARVAALGVGVVQNPSHLTLAEVMRARFGPERLATFQPLRSLVQKGIPLALGSDGPPSPFLNILFAVTHPTNPREALTREQAVTAYTRGSAWAEFAETEKGTLAPGFLADLVALSQDIFTVEVGRLPETASVLTVIGGRVVYDATMTSTERSLR